MGSQSPLPVILTMRQSVCNGAGFDKPVLGLTVTCFGEFEESGVHYRDTVWREQSHQLGQGVTEESERWGSPCMHVCDL